MGAVASDREAAPVREASPDELMAIWSSILAYEARRQRHKGNVERSQSIEIASLTLMSFGNALSKKEPRSSYADMLIDAADEALKWSKALTDDESKKGFLSISRFFRKQAEAIETGRYVRDQKTGKWQRVALPVEKPADPPPSK